MLKGLLISSFQRLSSNAPRNFKQSFKLQYKPTFRGILRRFERHNHKSAKALKFCSAVIGLSFVFLISLPSIGLPLQNHVKKWQYRKANDVNYYWTMNGSKPNKEQYILRKCQLVLSSINSHSEDWQWILQTLEDTLSQKQSSNLLTQKQVTFTKDQLSSSCRIQILTYSAIFLSKIIQLNSSLLKKQRTYSLFNNVLQQHMTDIITRKIHLKKQQTLQIIKNYLIFQYLLKYSNNKENLLGILEIYEKCIKQTKLIKFAEQAFHQKAFLNTLKAQYEKQQKQPIQRLINAKVISIFEYLDKLKKLIETQQIKKLTQKV